MYAVVKRVFVGRWKIPVITGTGSQRKWYLQQARVLSKRNWTHALTDIETKSYLGKGSSIKEGRP